MMRAWQKNWKVATSTVSAGCFFCYGAVFADTHRDNRPPTPEENQQELKDWQEVTEATARDLEVWLVPNTEEATDWQIDFEHHIQDAPLIYDGLDLVLESHEGQVIDDASRPGELKHQLELDDQVLTLSPSVFESMIKKDLQRWASDPTFTKTTWQISGSHLDIHAAQLALTEMESTGTFLVDAEAPGSISTASDLKITWELTGGQEQDQITLNFMAQDTGETEQLGQKWKYLISIKDQTTLPGIAKAESRIVQQTFHQDGWLAPVKATHQ